MHNPYSMRRQAYRGAYSEARRDTERTTRAKGEVATNGRNKQWREVGRVRYTSKYSNNNRLRYVSLAFI